MDRISRTEAWDLLSPQTGGYMPAAIEGGFWYANASRSLLGVIMPSDNGDSSFILFRRDDSCQYSRAAAGTGYGTSSGAERSMSTRAAELARNPT
jgi:hypothetical protein